MNDKFKFNMDMNKLINGITEYSNQVLGAAGANKELGDSSKTLTDRLRKQSEAQIDVNMSLKAIKERLTVEQESQAASKKTYDTQGKLISQQKTYHEALNKTITLEEKRNKQGRKITTIVSKDDPLKRETANAKALEKELNNVEKSYASVSDMLANWKSKSIASTPLVENSKSLAQNTIGLTNDYKAFGEVLKRVDKNTPQYEATRKEMVSLGRQIDDNTNKLKRNNVEIKNQDNFWLNMGYQWRKAFASFSMYLSVTTVFYEMTRSIGAMITNVTELDTALTELRKVTDLGGKSLEDFTKKAFDAGKSLAKTGQEVIEATTEFAKAGYDANTSMELGKIALKYTNIADEAINAADASSFIIAQMKAFNVEAGKSEHIIDAVNEVANKFAVSSADIANNIGISSSVLSNAGNTMEEALGLLTAGTEITRNASKVSNGLKTITLRLQGMNDEGEKELDLVPKLEESFNKLGLSLMDQDGNLKSTYDILKELAPEYQKMDSATKAYYTELVAGKYQAQNAAAILSNFETAINATETAMNSAGSATRENEKVLDSISGKTNKLNSSFKELSNSLVNSDLVKGIIDLGTALLDLAGSGVGQFIIQTGTATLLLSGLGIAFQKISTSKFIKDMLLANTATAGLEGKILSLGKTLLKSPLFWLAVTPQILGGIFSLFDGVQHKVEETYNKTGEEYEKSKQNVEDVNNELKTTQDRINELNSKDKLTITEKDELESLRKQNQELEITLQNLKDIQEEKRKAATEAANNKWNSTYGDSAIRVINPDDMQMQYITQGLHYGSSKRDYNVARRTGKLEDSDYLSANFFDTIVKRLNTLKKEGKSTTEEYQYLYDRLAYYYDQVNGQINNLSGKSKKDAQNIKDIISNAIYNNESTKKTNLSENFLTGDEYLNKYIEDLNTTSSALKILTDAQNEYNDLGYITVDTNKDLIDMGLDKYLIFTADGIQLNTSALMANNEALKQNALKQIEDAKAAERNALSQKKAALEMLKSLLAVPGFSIDTSKLGDLSSINQQLSGLDAKYQKYVDLINNTGISPSSSSSQEWWKERLENIEKQFNYNEITLQEYINSLGVLLSQLGRGSDAWKEVNDLLQQQKLSKVEEDYKMGTISLEQYIGSLKELIKTYKQGTNVWNDLVEKLKQANEELLNNRKDNYDKAHKAAIDLIESEIEKINDVREATEERYNTEIEAKKKANEETEREIELSKLQESLENARKEKNKRVFRAGIGWVWEADQEAIRDAENALKEFQTNDEIRRLEEERDGELAILDEKLKNWQDYKDDWSDITSVFEDTQNKLMLQQQMGADFESQILNDRLGALERFKNEYINIQQEMLDFTNVPINMVGNLNLVKSNKTSNVPSYSDGGMIDFTGLAMVHGTPSKPEWVLNSGQISNLLTSLVRPQTNSFVGANTNGNLYNYNFDKLILPNVTDGRKFFTELQSMINITKNQ